jgi:O-antigen/teichoic acid export membrane protein
LGIVLFIFPREFIVLVLGEKYLDALNVLKLFSVLIVFMFLTKLTERMLIVGRKQLVVTLITVLALGVNILFDLLLIPRMGIMGASLATLLAETSLFVLGMYYTYKFVSQNPVHLCILKVLLAYCLTCITVSLSDHYFDRTVGFVVGPTLFTSITLLLGTIPSAELRGLCGNVMKIIKRPMAADQPHGEVK